jgi:hypothetical protein
MRHLPSAGLAALAFMASASGVLADNFEFVVPGEAGLDLTITGYASDGAQMFEATASVPEQRDGESYYVVRIDDTILRSARLARWCVEDPSGSWSALSDRSGATSLCDDQPSETRGRYAFHPSPAAPDAAAEATVAPEMSAEEASSCVQEGLNRLGYDAGPVDGQMGRRTFAAALDFAAAQSGTPYPKLSAETAAAWCASMRTALADGTAQGPLEDLAQFRFGPDIDARVAQDTEQGIVEIDAYFKKVFGSALAKPATIYVSSDADWMADAYVAILHNPGLRRGKLDWFKGCHGGEAGPGFLFMCAKSDVFSQDWFGAGHKGQRAFALTHEYFHIVQFERIGQTLEGCCTGERTLETVGPQWLVEGSAEYMAFRLLADSGRMDFKREIAWHTQKAAEVASTLEQMETREGFYAEQRASSSGMIASHLLAERAGLASLAQFYTEMGRTKDWKVAFEAAFGITPADFYKEYADRIH